uniref:DUF4160 domain-containing protein n=2 Tax=unclassified Candidatus Kentrum TaxID=2643149 RepID=A0A450W6U4_9GAMM|nr:MAG: protein of unknown function (DUF4160) [Candidatus Kentron sp. LPFa]
MTKNNAIGTLWFRLGRVRYNEYRASMNIQDLNLIDGFLPARVRGLVIEWAELHRNELLRMWKTKEFHRIEPLV